MPLTHRPPADREGASAPAAPLPAPGQRADIEQRLARLERLFRKSADQPADRFLRNAVTSYRMGRPA